MKYEDKIRQILVDNLGDKNLVSACEINGGLPNIGLDSMAFISVVVAIETEFDIEFPDEMLILSNDSTISQLCEIVESSLKTTLDEI